jgi:signal transduction histidine kinase
VTTGPDDIGFAEVGARSEQEALQRLELLVGVSKVLAGALDDYAHVMVQVAETCVPAFCDLCAIEVTAPGGEPEVLAYRVAPSAELSAPPVWAPAGASCGPTRTPALSYPRPADPDNARRLRERLGAQSLIVAPISAGGVTLGWLIMATGAGRRGFRPSAVSVAEDVSGRLATAIQRTLLYRESVTSAHHQAKTAQRLRRLAAATANLAGAVTPEEVLRVACVEICIVLDADAAAARWCSVGQADLSTVAGRPEAAVVEEAMVTAVAKGSARGPGWMAQRLPCADAGDRAAIAVMSSRQFSADEELMLASLAAMVPVAFERARSTAAALAREAELDAVLEASPVAIVRVGITDGVVAVANGAAKELFGWTRDPNTARRRADRPNGPDGSAHALPDRSFPDAIAPTIFQLLGEASARGSVANRPVTAEGFDLSVAVAPMPAVAGVAPSVLVAATDLSEQRAVERALLQAQRLEAMGQVAGGIAHDFNNLLTVMTGYVSILQRSLADDAARAMVDKIDTAVGRAASLTQKLLGFTRQLDAAVVLDLAAAARGLLSVLTRLAGPGIAVHAQLPATPTLVVADPSEVEQMILNLCINARDALGDDGAITLSVGTADLDDSAAGAIGVSPGAYATLSVSDDGPGMSEAVRSRCLEPFFTTKEKGAGSGLGLSSVYGLTAERGGALAIDTAPGEGTTVWVWLPRSSGSPAATRTTALGDGFLPALTGRALLVEDEEDLRSLARHALRATGLVVVDAPNGEAALRVGDSGDEWDVLVTDIVLPGMSGIELASRLRERHPKLPVLYVSGYADHDTRKRGLVDGARLLRKPYRPDDLCRHVADLLGPPSG